MALIRWFCWQEDMFFLMDEIQQVVAYLAGSNRFNLTPLEMLLEIAEIGGIYPYGMVTVTHLLKFSR